VACPSQCSEDTFFQSFASSTTSFESFGFGRVRLRSEKSKQLQLLENTSIRISFFTSSVMINSTVQFPDNGASSAKKNTLSKVRNIPHLCVLHIVFGLEMHAEYEYYV
jgi:hypothetical protein